MGRTVFLIVSAAYPNPSCSRCVFKSSAMGQANAARDKLYDLRECDMR